MEDISNLHKIPILISINLGNNYPLKPCPQRQITTLLNTLQILSKDSVIIPVSKSLLRNMWKCITACFVDTMRGAAGPQK